MADVGRAQLVHAKQLGIHPILWPQLGSFGADRMTTTPESVRLLDCCTISVAEGHGDDGAARPATSVQLGIVAGGLAP